jgi:hypothetical protein
VEAEAESVLKELNKTSSAATRRDVN